MPPTGFTAWLTLFSAGAMAFLAVFALALSLATGRLAERWGDELARTATVRISAPEAQMAAQTAAALRVLETTTGVARARALDDAEQAALLEPWFGPDLPIDNCPSRLIEVIETAEGFDADGLRLRLQAEVPGAVLDDHTRWRAPLVRAADRLRLYGLAVASADRRGDSGDDYARGQCRPCRQYAGHTGAAARGGARQLYRAGLRAALHAARPGWGCGRHICWAVLPFSHCQAPMRGAAF